MSPLPRVLAAPVLTVLEPDERSRVDAAGAGFYRTIHRETVADALEELKHRAVSALLLSVVRCGRERDRRMHAVVREFPTVPAVALLGGEPASAEALLHLGNAGVTKLVDVRSPAGWAHLRRLLGAEASREADRGALQAIRAELGDVSTDCWTFFEALLSTSDRVATVRALATRMSVLPSTLMSRFFRAGLPAPKRYLAYVRLLRAARLFEDPVTPSPTSRMRSSTPRRRASAGMCVRCSGSPPASSGASTAASVCSSGSSTSSCVRTARRCASCAPSS